MLTICLVLSFRIIQSSPFELTLILYVLTQYAFLVSFEMAPCVPMAVTYRRKPKSTCERQTEIRQGCYTLVSIFVCAVMCCFGLFTVLGQLSCNCYLITVRHTALIHCQIVSMIYDVFTAQQQCSAVSGRGAKSLTWFTKVGHDPASTSLFLMEKHC